MPSFPPHCTHLNALMCCANCGKEEDEPFKLKMCTACRSVCYCNVNCQKTHRKNHKHQCNLDVQILKRAANSLLERNSNKAEGDDDDNGDDFFSAHSPE